MAFTKPKMVIKDLTGMLQRNVPVLVQYVKQTVEMLTQIVNTFPGYATNSLSKLTGRFR